MANHAIVHLDIPAPDPAAAAKFYSEVFGWQLHHDEQYDYWMFSTEGGPGGGFVQTGASEMGPSYNAGEVLIYLNTDDLNASLAQVEAAGGQRRGSVVEMPGDSGFAFFADPTGNTIGLYKAPTPAS